MRRRQINQMRVAAQVPGVAHPSAPVEPPQQPAAVSVPPAPPPAPDYTEAVEQWQRMPFEEVSFGPDPHLKSMTHEGPPVMFGKRKRRK